MGERILDLPKLKLSLGQNLEWQSRGNCNNHPELTVNDFFYETKFKKRNSVELREHLAKLRRICAFCPVRQECRDWADTIKATHGFFGGETPSARKLRHARKRYERDERDERKTECI